MSCTLLFFCGFDKLPLLWLWMRRYCRLNLTFCCCCFVSGCFFYFNVNNSFNAVEQNVSYCLRSIGWIDLVFRNLFMIKAIMNYWLKSTPRRWCEMKNMQWPGFYRGYSIKWLNESFRDISILGMKSILYWARWNLWQLSFCWMTNKFEGHFVESRNRIIHHGKWKVQRCGLLNDPCCFQSCV